MSQPRVIRASQNRRLQVPQDLLDCDPLDESSNQEDIKTSFASRVSHNLGEIQSHHDSVVESEGQCELNQQEQKLRGISCSSLKMDRGYADKGSNVPLTVPVEQEEETKGGLEPLEETMMTPTALASPPSYEEEEGEGGGLGLGFRLGVEAMSPPPPRMDKSLKTMPRPWSPRLVFNGHPVSRLCQFDLYS